MSPTTIIALSAEPLDLPLTEPFAIATGRAARGAQRAGAPAARRRHRGPGRGRALHRRQWRDAGGHARRLQPLRELLLGQDARAWRPLSAWLTEALPHEPSARCGVETALLDALSRHHRVPLSVFFGGAGTELDIDMTVTAGRPGARGVLGARHPRPGHHTLKVKVGALRPRRTWSGWSPSIGWRPRPGSSRMPTAATRVRAGARLPRRAGAGRVPLSLFEQPVAAEDFEGMAELTRESRVPICADESARSAQDVLRLIRERAASGINIKTDEVRRRGVARHVAPGARRRAWS